MMNDCVGRGRVADVDGPVSSAEIEAFMARLALESPAVSDPERVDRMRALEGLKSAAAAAQAHDMVAFADSQLDGQAAQGLPARDRGSGIPSQIGLACRQSPHKASRMLTTARALLDNLPQTLAALARGETTEHRASLIAKETNVLDSDQRRRVDAELAPRLGELGDRATEAEAHRWSCRLAPAEMAERAARASADRRVTIRPAPDTMAHLTGLLPVKDGVAVYAALDAAAKAAIAAGDTRGRGQIMADTLVERVTGVASGAHPIEISLIMTDRALLAEGDEPAHVHGYGSVPAEVARRWILAVLDRDDDGGRRARRHKRGRVWLRRLFTSPDGRDLVAMDSRRRTFPRMMRRLIEFRDQVCATPYCDAQIRHIDHVTPVREGGATSYANGRGTCARCNYAKEAPGWSASVTDSTRQPSGGDRVVTLQTPTGRLYPSRPPPPQLDQASQSASKLDRLISQVLQSSSSHRHVTVDKRPY